MARLPSLRRRAAPPAPDPAADFMTACQECDRAAQALVAALIRRREMLRLLGMQPGRNRSVVHGQMSRRGVDRALAAHGFRDHATLEPVAAASRRNFVDQAKALLGAAATSDEEDDEEVVRP